MKLLGWTALFVALPVWATASQIDVAGRWATVDKTSHVEISDCGDGTPCGKVVWFTPFDESATDANNPDPDLQTRPIMGLTMLSGYKRKGEGWKGGTIYDPEAGKSYSSKIKLREDGTLEVKGCIAFLCDTQIWTRVEQSASN